MSIKKTESETSARDVQRNSLPPTKKRKPNWTPDEWLVEELKGILRAKFGKGVTTAKKREIWRKIIDVINASSSKPYEWWRLRKRWHIIQMKGKQSWLRAGTHDKACLTSLKRKSCIGK
jgi:hypothetical protein